MLGHEAGWGWKRAGVFCRGGRACRAGAADYSRNCQLQCLQSGLNRFRVGGGGSHCRFLSSQPLPVRLSQLSRMTFVRATLEMSHHLILSLIIHSPARAHWLRPCCLPLMETLVTDADILTLKQSTDTGPELQPQQEEAAILPTKRIQIMQKHILGLLKFSHATKPWDLLPLPPSSSSLPSFIFLFLLCSSGLLRQAASL